MLIRVIVMHPIVADFHDLFARVVDSIGAHIVDDIHQAMVNSAFAKFACIENLTSDDSLIITSPDFRLQLALIFLTVPIIGLRIM